MRNTCIYMSRRRQVTEFEKDEALSATDSLACHLDGTTFVLTMRQSFDYRYFHLVSSCLL